MILIEPSPAVIYIKICMECRQVLLAAWWSRSNPMRQISVRCMVGQPSIREDRSGCWPLLVYAGLSLLVDLAALSSRSHG